MYTPNNTTLHQNLFLKCAEKLFALTFIFSIRQVYYLANTNKMTLANGSVLAMVVTFYSSLDAII